MELGLAGPARQVRTYADTVNSGVLNFVHQDESSLLIPLATSGKTCSQVITFNKLQHWCCR